VPSVIQLIKGSPVVLELLRDHKAFVLLFGIANQASENGGGKGLALGEARIDFQGLNLSRGEYRGAYARLEALGVISSRPSKDGIVHKIIMDNLFIPSTLDSEVDIPPLQELPKFEACPQKEIIALYHEICPDLPPVLSWNRTMTNNLRTRWREDPVRQNLGWWEKFLKVSINESDFLCGRVEPWNTTLDWIVIKKNWDKIINGRYRNRKRSPEETRHAPKIYVPPE